MNLHHATLLIENVHANILRVQLTWIFSINYSLLPNQKIEIHCISSDSRVDGGCGVFSQFQIVYDKDGLQVYPPGSGGAIEDYYVTDPTTKQRIEGTAA